MKYLKSNIFFKNDTDLQSGDTKNYEIDAIQMNILKENDLKVMSIIESYIFIFSEPISIDELKTMLKINSIHLSSKDIKRILELLIEKYSRVESGLELLRLEDKYQLVTKKDNYEYIEKATSKIKKKTLTQSAMETLTIIAYNQPTTKSFVEKIKGVKSDTTFGKLLEANLIEECGRLEKIGRPVLYKTTDRFLKYLGINSIEELPKVESKKDEDEIL